MLAKLGITSPFNKRKIKEINSAKQMLHQQQQQQQQPYSNQIGSMPSQNGSSIPTPKKIQSNLPVFHSSVHRNSNLISSTDSSSFGFNNSKKSYNSSRSGSPSSIAESTTSSSQLSKQATSKLPQFQMNSNSTNSMGKDNRKIGIAKPSKTSIPQGQLTSSKLTNPKIQQSSSVYSNNLATKQNSDKSKKIGLVQNQNLQSQSQTQMPVLVSNVPVQAANSTKLAQGPSKKTTSTFGLSKLTKTSTKNESEEQKSSKIPSTISGIKPQLKSPSIQFNSNSPIKIPVVSRIAANNSARQPSSTPNKRSNIPSKPNLSSGASKDSPSKSNLALVASSTKHEEKKETESKESDLDDEILGSMNDINEDNVNEEEFQKFLSSNLDEENIVNCKTECSNKDENLSIVSELPSPPPPSSSDSETKSSSVTDSINHSNMPVNSINLNSFGRSNTLDRKLKPLNQDASKFKNNSFKQNADDYKEQRNSLNIQLKSPSSGSYRSSFQNSSSKRPLSQEPIMEITAEIPIDTCHTYNSNISSEYGFNQAGTMSKIQQLSYELENAKNRILSLTNQLNSNAQLVYTLEQTVSAMSTKLQNEVKNSQKKDATIGELKSYIDHLQIKYPKIFDGEKNAPLSPFNLNRHNSNESLNSLNSMFSHRSYQSSVVTTNTEPCNDNFSKKKKSWLRSSFSRAFRKNSSRYKTDNSENKSIDGKSYLSDVEEKELIDKIGYGEFSLPNSPMHQQILNSRRNDAKSHEECEEFQRLLRDKEIKLTDIRLEALATAHQLDQTKEENLKMKMEIEQLKSENLRMQQLLGQQTQILHYTPTSVSSPSPSASVISSSSNNSKMNLSLSNSSHNVENLIFNHTSTSSASSVSLLKSPISNGLSSTDSNMNEGKRVLISIYIGNLDNPLDDLEQEQFNGQILIGSINLTTKTKWDTLDSIIRKLFSDYLNKLESNSIESGGLGLGLDSIDFYIVGDMFRKTFDSEQKVPDLLPYGYLVGNFTNIVIKLKDASSNSVDSLSYDTLVPKNVMLRYISIVLEFKNLLLCGPSGTCKSYIARKIAEYLMKKEKKSINESIFYLNAENKTIKDLKIYLNNLESSNDPLVLILDNLQFITNIHEAFSDYFSNNLAHTKLFYIIGTINQSNVTALNLHPNFKWVLFVNHTEPVKNFLTRSLERRLVDQISKMNETKMNQMEVIIDWIPKLWIHVNKYIEAYNSVDLCIGPKEFAAFPFDFKQSSEWFIDFWNHVLVPLITSSVHEGIIVYGTKLDWEDPKLWLAHTLPWLSIDGAIMSRLKSIKAKQVGLDQLEDEIVHEENRRYSSFPNTPSKIMSRNSHDNDKLLTMLMKLQEATGLSGQNHLLHLESNTTLVQNIKSLTYSNNVFNKSNLIES